MKRRRRRRGGYRVKGPIHAKASLKKVLDRYGVARELREHRLLFDWTKIVGTRVAARSTPSGLDRGTLWIQVEHSSWLHELSFLGADIAAKANEVCGSELVKEVRFHVGGRRTRSEDALAPVLKLRRPPAKKRPLPAPAAGESLRIIEEETAQVDDPELREAIRAARQRLDL